MDPGENIQRRRGKKHSSFRFLSILVYVHTNITMIYVHTNITMIYVHANIHDRVVVAIFLQFFPHLNPPREGEKSCL